MNLGQKNYRGLKFTGVKSFGQTSVGNKLNPLSKGVNGIIAHTPSGIINNYSNSAEVAREPMKGVPIGKPKSHFQIEKPKSNSKSDSDKFQ